MIESMTKTFFHISVLTNVMFAFILVVKLRVSPVDVLNEVKSQAGELRMMVGKTEEKTAAISEELDRRGVWMESVDTELATRTRDRIYRSEFKEWCAKAKILNPNVVIPMLDSDGEMCGDNVP